VIFYEVVDFSAGRCFVIGGSIFSSCTAGRRSFKCCSLCEIFGIRNSRLCGGCTAEFNLVVLMVSIAVSQLSWSASVSTASRTFSGWVQYAFRYTLYIHNFWAACPCPEKQSCPDIFHCIEQVFFIIQKFWVTCACPEKQRVPWNFSLDGIYFLHSGVIGQFACAFPEKQRVPWYFSLYWTCIFYHSGFLNNLRLPWKTEGALNSLYWMCFFIIQDFWATCACPEIFRCIEYIFY